MIYNWICAVIYAGVQKTMLPQQGDATCSQPHACRCDAQKGGYNFFFFNHLIFSYDGSKFDCMMNMTNLKNLFFVFCEVHEAKKVALELKLAHSYTRPCFDNMQNKIDYSRPYNDIMSIDSSDGFSKSGSSGAWDTLIDLGGLMWAFSLISFGG